MHIRIREVRKLLKMSQKDFGNKLGLTQTTLSMIEIGKSVIVEKNVKLICTTFNINEHWLRTGEGEMFCASPHEREFQNIFSKLTPDTQRCLLLIARELFNVQQKLLGGIDTDNITSIPCVNIENVDMENSTTIKE
jgi:transcriptional regulator with XRE-family HTH domain